MKTCKRFWPFAAICLTLTAFLLLASACGSNYVPAVTVEDSVKYYFTLPAEEFEKAYNDNKADSMPEEKFKEYTDAIDLTKHIANTESQLDSVHINLAFTEDKAHLASVTLVYFAENSASADDYIGAMRAAIKALNIPVAKEDLESLEDWTSDGTSAQTKTVIVKDKNEQTETKLYLILSRKADGKLQQVTFQMIAQAQTK